MKPFPFPTPTLFHRLAASLLLLLTTACAPVDFEQALLDGDAQSGADRWHGPSRTDDPMSGYTTWSVLSPFVRPEGHTAQSWQSLLPPRLGFSMICSTDPGVPPTVAFTLVGAYLPPTNLLASGFGENAVQIQWDGDPATLAQLHLVHVMGTSVAGVRTGSASPAGQVLSVRGDEVADFLVQLRTRGVLRVRLQLVGPLFRFDLEDAPGMWARLAPHCSPS